MTQVSPDVIVIAESQVEQHRIAKLLPEMSLACESSFSPRGVRRPRALVVVAPSCESSFAERTILECKRYLLEKSSILVTRFDPENARAVVRKWKGETVWLEEVEHGLEKVVIRVLGWDLPRRVLDLLTLVAPERCGNLTGGILNALENPPPPLNLEGLSLAAGIDLKELRREWKEAGFPDRPEALVDWSILARVVELRSRGWSLNRACTATGTDSRRAQRAALRRAGIPAGKLDEARLLAALRRWLDAG